MIWRDLPPEVREQVASVLTVKQLDVVRLSSSGMSVREIALALDCSRTTVREHLIAADRRLRRAELAL